MYSTLKKKCVEITQFYFAKGLHEKNYNNLKAVTPGLVRYAGRKFNIHLNADDTYHNKD